MTPNVIDISHHNTVRDFGALRDAGILGVIHKATEGTSYRDPCYDQRRKAAKSAGLLWGAYHFNSGDDVRRQVDHFFRVADPQADTLMALDFEDARNNMSIAQAIQFLELSAAKLGRNLVLYSGNRIKDLLGNKVNTFLGSHPLWLAQYGPRAVVQRSWTKPWLWQFSERGRLPGTDGNIDLNFYAGEHLASEWASRA